MTEHILDVEALTVSFDGFTVLDDLDFTLDYGELRFLIGPNGAGKTTLLDLITGKTRPGPGPGRLAQPAPMLFESDQPHRALFAETWQ